MNHALPEAHPPGTCLSCGEATATRIERDYAFPYAGPEGEVTINARIPVISCSSCGDELIDEEGERIQHEAVCVYLGRLMPREIRDLRRRFDLNQDEFAQATKIGVASIKRWESGTLIQNEAMDRYLRLLSKSDLLATLLPRYQSAPVFRTQITQVQRDRAETFKLRSPARETKALEPCEA